ncbi:putative non-specific serine/threonine protein kinase [Helianthus anomalus]
MYFECGWYFRAVYMDRKNHEMGDLCDRKNGYINDSPPCGCLRGFEPRFPEEWRRADWDNGCVRKMELDCAAGGDGFVKQSGVKVPDTRRSWFNASMNLEEYESECLRKCNCTAYASLNDSTRTRCLIWFNELIDMRVYAEDGQDIFVRMATSELGGKTKTSSCFVKWMTKTTSFLFS